MLFSVIIPSFNREETIGLTLESVEAQAHTDFEVVIVDDGSTDGTVGLISEHDVSVIEQDNSGPGASRNAGVAAAKGEYLAFLDSDDCWLPWTLDVYRQVIEQTKRPAIVTGCPQIFREPAELRRVEQANVDIQVFPDYFASGEDWLWHGVSSFVIRRDVFIEAGGFTNLRVNGEDAELLMRLGTAPGFVHISSPVTFGYRVHPGNITLNYTKSLNGLELLIEGERCNRYPGGTERATERSTIISQHVRPFVFTAIRSGNIQDAWKLYRAVVRECLLKRRWRFLLGVPILSILALLKKMFRVAGTD